MFQERVPALDRKLVYEKAREYIGTPFHQQGRIKRVGLDCVGIVLCVGEELGLRYRDDRPIGRFDYMDYGLFPVLDEMQTEAERIFNKKSLDQLRPGDILTMRAPRLIHHMAIVSQLQGGLGVIHAFGSEQIMPRKASRTVEHLLDTRWKRFIAGVFSYPGVDD
jgi:hypothetical protein